MNRGLFSIPVGIQARGMTVSRSRLGVRLGSRTGLNPTVETGQTLFYENFESYRETSPPYGDYANATSVVSNNGLTSSTVTGAAIDNTVEAITGDVSYYCLNPTGTEDSHYFFGTYSGSELTADPDMGTYLRWTARIPSGYEFNSANSKHMYPNIEPGGPWRVALHLRPYFFEDSGKAFWGTGYPSTNNFLRARPHFHIYQDTSGSDTGHDSTGLWDISQDLVTSYNSWESDDLRYFPNCRSGVPGGPLTHTELEAAGYYFEGGHDYVCVIYTKKDPLGTAGGASMKLWVGVDGGPMELWIDYTDESDFVWLDAETTAWKQANWWRRVSHRNPVFTTYANGLQVSNYHGGGGSNGLTHPTQYILYDEIRCATTYQKALTG